MKVIQSAIDHFNRVYVLNPSETFVTEKILENIVGWQSAVNERGPFELARTRKNLANQKMRAHTISNRVNKEYYLIPGLTALDTDAQIIRFKDTTKFWKMGRDLETTLGQLKCNDPIFKYTLIHKLSEGEDRNIEVKDIGPITLQESQTLVMTSSHYYAIKPTTYSEYLFCRVPATVLGIINKAPKKDTDPNLKRSI